MPIEVSKEQADKRTKRMMTDAALDRKSAGLGGVLGETVESRRSADGKLPVIRAEEVFYKFISRNVLECLFGYGRQANIQSMEAFSILIALTIWEKELEDYKLLICTDNIIVLYGLITGTSNCPVTSAIISLCVEKLGKTWYYPMFITSRLNQADALTRYEKLCQIRGIIEQKTYAHEDVDRRLWQDIIPAIIRRKRLILGIKGGK